MSQQYFLWDDDVAIPFRTNDLGEWVVSGDAVLDMVRSVLWHHAQGDASPIGVLTPQEVIESITGLLKTYQPKIDEVVLEGYDPDDFPLCDQHGGVVRDEPLCVCLHPIRGHQTGEGPWTGFCGGTVYLGANAEPCDCEGPVEA